jgi:hypothetical protein
MVDEYDLIEAEKSLVERRNEAKFNEALQLQII